MRGLYGSQWEREFGPEPSPAWIATLRGLDDHEIRRGLRYTAEQGRRLPPTAPEFRSWCRPQSQRTPEQRALYGRIEREDAPRSLEQLAAGSETGRRWLAFWWAEGIRPRPPNVTDDELAQLCPESQRARMRAEVANWRKAIATGKRAGIGG